jgi:serine/threonine-protein kinase
LAGLDSVFAVAMAKEPSGRFGSCQDFTDQLSRYLSQGSSSAGAVPFPDTQPGLDATSRAPVPPLGAPPIGKRRRARVLIGALVGVALLIAGGVFAVVKLTGHHNPAVAGAPGNSGVPTGTESAANTGPFTGTYQVQLGQGSTLDGKPAASVTPGTAIYAVRSVCRSSGCVATASRLDGERGLALNMVFDQVDGRWLAVVIVEDRCRNMVAEIWEVFTLQPGPEGTFTGEYRGAAANGCNEKRSLTFTRAGDVDIKSLPDPASLPPRVASPAEALHGRYHIARTFSKIVAPQQENQAVKTDCLRTGDRCMSYFYSRTADTPLVFSGGNWVMDIHHPETITGCEDLEVKTSEQLPMPQPPQNPITRLTGHGHHEQTGNCALNVDFDEIYTRTGD